VRARVVASAALAALLAVGVAGCAFLTPSATEKHYDASDGVSATIGDVKVLNVLAIAGDSDETKGDASLVFTAVNSSDGDVTLRVQYRGSTQSLKVAPGSTDVGFGSDGDEHLQLSPFDDAPGSLAPVFFQYGDEEGQKIKVPVLDTTWAQYSDLGPTATPTPTPTPTATGTATPGADQTDEPSSNG